MRNQVTIDGSSGGGQVLRSALSLAALLGVPVHFTNIRANRPQPGLQKHHLQCISFLAELTGAQVAGASLRSSTLLFVPPLPSAGSSVEKDRDKRKKQQYRYCPRYPALNGKVFDLSSKRDGSIALVVQVLLPVLVFACDGPSNFIVKGGTHSGSAPTSTLLTETFFPILRQMGINVRGVTKKIGFTPFGGGEVEVFVEPCEDPSQLSPVDLSGPRQETGPIEVIIIHSPVLSQEEKETNDEQEDDEDARDGDQLRILPDVVTDLKTQLREKLPETVDIKAEEVRCDGLGCAAMAKIPLKGFTMILASTHNRHEPTPIAKSCIRQFSDYVLCSDCLVDEYLSDQLLVPCALAGGIRYRTPKLSDHFRTNIDVIEQFLGGGVVKSIRAVKASSAPVTEMRCAPPAQSRTKGDVSRSMKFTNEKTPGKKSTWEVELQCSFFTRCMRT